MQFQYQAMTGGGAMVTDVIDAESPRDAAEELRSQGLMVMRVSGAKDAPLSRGKTAAVTQGKTKGSDLLLFARQMKMLLEAGAAIVPALEAIENQANRPGFRRLIRDLREHVENGGSLVDGMQARPDIFKPVFCSMVGAGEATASLPQVFDRLATLTLRQSQMRKAIIGALLYPCLLTLMCVGVVALMVCFIVPRFRSLFENLKTKLPASTEVMFALSDMARDYWPFMLAGVVVLIASTIVAIRVRAVREALDPWLLRLPLFGPLLARLQLARILRVWAAMLRCNVPLLEAIAQSRRAATNIVFVTLVTDLEESVSAGGRIGHALTGKSFVEPVVASAIATGEDNGRLTEAVDFTSGWIDDENTQMVASVMKTFEPLLLAVMGVVVGLVAMSLFLPLFDIASAAG
ncbi:MAG: type II secretion system F family protein [Phycisphaerae bacterium]|nr:type II secretion system F family protein [Phycisphaerae bacterium]